MFTTQCILPNKSRSKYAQQKKIKIDFNKLLSFYNHLIQDPIKPNIQQFFILQDKVDIQQKFDKYHEKSIIQDQSSGDDGNDGDQLRLSHSNVHKKNINIVFRLQHSLHQPHHHNNLKNHISQSKISYFQISESLKNAVGSNSLFRKFIDTKKQQRQNIELLKHFLYQEQAVFYLIKGHVQLQKKIEQIQNKNNKVNSVQKVSSSNEKSSINKQQKNEHIVMSVLSSFFGGSTPNSQINNQSNIEQEAIYLKKQLPKKQWKKHQQVRQGSFFSLINFKSLHNLPQPQYYKLIPKSQCIIAKILINSQFGSGYVKKQEQKLKVLSSVLLNSNRNEQTKSQTFKTLFNAFEEQTMKRQMVICQQGKFNQNIYILGLQSQVELSKKVYFKQNQNIQGHKNLKISTVKGPSVFNAEIFVQQSKTVINLLKTHSFHKKSNKNQYQKNNIDQQNTKSHNRHQSKNSLHLQQSKHGNHQRQLQGLQRQIVHRKKTSHHERRSSLLPYSEKVYFGKDQKTYFQFLLPQTNKCNFNIKANTSYVTVYRINLNRFNQIATQKMKIKVSANFQQFYITNLRKSQQKLQLFYKQLQVSANKKINQVQKYQALASIKRLTRQSPQLKNQHDVQISIAKLEFQNKKQLKGLKRNQLVYRQGQVLQKKMQMLRNKRKDKEETQALTKTFKKKIQNLIIQNLKDIKVINNEKLQQGLKGGQSTDLNKFYTQNLTQILTSHRINNSQKYHLLNDQQSTKSIQKIQKIKQQDQPSVKKQLLVDPDIFNPSKNKKIKISLLRKGHPCVMQNRNYLKGVQINEFTDSIKSHVSVRINQTNKIKEQFLKIQSKCQCCKCYEDLDSYRNLSQYHSTGKRPHTQQYRHSSQDVKYHTMKIGVNWKTKYSNLGKVQSKTAYDEKGLQKRMSQMAHDDQPFEKVYNRIKVLKAKSLQKFNFNQHLLKRGQDLKTKRSHKRSSPLLP